MKTFAALLAFGICASTFAFTLEAPDRVIPQAEKKPEPPTIKQIAGPCNFGEIKQFGHVVRIEGCPTWHVDIGQIREDGKLAVVWINDSTGRMADGLYTLNPDGSIEGFWGWQDRVWADDDGVMKGLDCRETLRRAN
jgi:hypothetical protein